MNEEIKLLPIGAPVAVILLTREEAKELIKYIYAQGYLSHEFHGEVYTICKKLEEFIEQ